MLLSIIQGIFKTKTKIGELAIKAKAGNEEVMNDLLFASTHFLKKQQLLFVNEPLMNMMKNLV